ncbi:MAG: LON peptidase substrate-binding domain-containing protein [Myxococcota bacterium]
MSDSDGASEFPTTFPIFPLPGVVLFPGTYLPLHIFEPRYRAMTEAALASDELIGMVLLRRAEDAQLQRAETFEIGCAGRIVESERLADGRFNLLLHGERRFAIEREEGSGVLYRSVQARLLPDPSFPELAPDVQRRLSELRGELEARMLELVRLTAPPSAEQLAERMRALDPMLLVNALSFGLDCPTLEKQSLLEAPTPVVQGELLLRILIIRIAETRLPEGPKIVN